MTINERELSFIEEFSVNSSKKVMQKAEALVIRKNLKDPIIEEASNIATKVAQSFCDKKCQPPPPFPRINLPEDSTRTDSIEYIKYQLVLDFLQSIGCKFTPAVFQKETQNPSLFNERSEIAEKLSLRQYDKTPLLVQLIEAIRSSK